MKEKHLMTQAEFLIRKFSKIYDEIATFLILCNKQKEETYFFSTNK